MGKKPGKELAKKLKSLPSIATATSYKRETFAGKQTARVTDSYVQPDGSTVILTRKINKDGSISDKIEHRHK